jgi:hypothetical protein
MFYSNRRDGLVPAKPPLPLASSLSSPPSLPLNSGAVARPPKVVIAAPLAVAVLLSLAAVEDGDPGPDPILPIGTYHCLYPSSGCVVM